MRNRQDRSVYHRKMNEHKNIEAFELKKFEKIFCHRSWRGGGGGGGTDSVAPVRIATCLLSGSFYIQSIFAELQAADGRQMWPPSSECYCNNIVAGLRTRLLRIYLLCCTRACCVVYTVSGAYLDTFLGRGRTFTAFVPCDIEQFPPSPFRPNLTSFPPFTV